MPGLAPFGSHAALAGRITWFDAPEDARPSTTGCALPPFAHQQLAAWRLVGRGPCRMRHPVFDASAMAGSGSDAWLWVRRDADDALYLALHEAVPPSLFIPLGQSPELLIEQLETWFGPDPLEVPARGLDPDIEAVRRSLQPPPAAERCDLILAVGAMRDVENDLLATGWMHSMADFGTVPGADGVDPDLRQVIRTRVRGRYSKAVVHVEAWAGFFEERVLLARVFYTPRDSRGVVTAFNRERNATLPDAFPIDVLGQFRGTMLSTTGDLERQLRDSDDIGFAAIGALLLGMDTPANAQASIARLIAHPRPEVRDVGDTLAGWLESVR
jgi:hypothetical protein